MVSTGEQWEELRKGSINGFYNIVVSLGWWIEAATTDPERAGVYHMVSDAMWVVDQMLATPRITKRGPDIDDPPVGHSNKRQVEVHCIQQQANAWVYRVKTA